MEHRTEEIFYLKSQAKKKTEGGGGGRGECDTTWNVGDKLLRIRGHAIASHEMVARHEKRRSFG